MPDRTNATTTGAGILHPERLGRVAVLDRLPCAPDLADYVENYWTLRWELPAGVTQTSSVLPHPACTLSVEWGDTRPEVGADPVVVTGVATRRFDVELAGTGRVFAAKFRPGGLAALTSGTASAWRDATFAAVDIFPASLLAPLRDLDPLDSSERCAQRFDEVLRAAVASAPDSAATEGGYAQVLRVVRDMLDDHTLVGVGQVERRHGLGTRQLQRLFARYVGVSPKWVLARFRMHDAVVELDAGFRGSLADLAVRHGWYDQSHFTRDFRRLVGVAPGAYVARPR